MFTVVRQAMLQNQDPEIQAKLMAMQRQMASQMPATPPVADKPITVTTLTSLPTAQLTTSLAASKQAKVAEHKEEQIR